MDLSSGALQHQPPNKSFYNVHGYSVLNRYSKTTGSCLVHVLCSLDAVRGRRRARAEPSQLPSHLDGSDGQSVGWGWGGQGPQCWLQV